MKKLFSLFFIALFCCLSASAQDAMRIKKTDGSSIIINIDEIKEIDFPSGSMVYLDLQSWYLHPQQTAHANAYVVEDKALTSVDANWSTSDAAIATVDQTGCITGVGNGTAIITAEYLGETSSLTVKVTTESAFDISVTDITNTSCRYRITPKDSNVRYYYNMRNTHGDYSVDSMDEHGSVEENLFYFTQDWFQFVAEQYGDRTWNEAMQPQLQEGPANGTNSEFYSVLVPGTEYTLYAMGFDEDGNLSTPIETYVFETTAPTKSDMTFDIAINRCLSTDAQFTITPSNNNEPYLVCVQRANYVEWFIERDRVEDMAQPMIESFANDSRYPAIQRGPVTLLCSDFVNVRSNEDYYVIVFGYDEGQTTPITLKHFVTKYGWTEADDEKKDEIIDVTPPADLATVDCVFTAYDYYLDENDEVVYEPFDPMAGEIGKVGNDVYMRGMLGAMTDKWMKGTYDPANHTLTFKSPQYMGQFNFWGEGPEDFYVCGGNLDTDEMCSLVFDYNPTTGRFTLRENLALVVNGKPFEWSVNMMMLNVGIVTEHPLF